MGISGASGRLTVENDRLTVAAQGTMNGGTIELSGSLPLRSSDAAAPPTDGLRARATSVLIEWPDGLRSMIDADLTYRADPKGGLVAGRVSVEPGAYRRAAPPSFSEPGGRAAGPEAAPSALDATRLDLTIATRTPGLMDNSYARLAVEGDARVGGTIGQPSISGRLLAREGGEIYLRGNVFKIERASLDLNPGPAATPSVTLLAGTRRSGYDITLRVTGPADDLHVVLDLRPAPRRSPT